MISNKGDFMKYRYLNNIEIYEEKPSIILRFLYNTLLGRCVLKIITLNIVSKIIGKILKSRISIPIIKRYIHKYSIDMTKYENKKYKSFNDFFIRKLKNNKFESDKQDFIAVASSKISCYEIFQELLIDVKNSTYSIVELLKDINIVKDYEGGICLIYRLSPADYHRYIFCDKGTQKYIKKIKGKLHTVNPIVYEKYKVFSENYREITKLYTENFGEIVQIEVGALCVGKIVNKEVKQYNKYDEKGYFEFGGSTIIQIIKKDKVKISNQIIENTKNNIETFADIGEVIGKSYNKN